MSAHRTLTFASGAFVLLCLPALAADPAPGGGKDEKPPASQGPTLSISSPVTIDRAVSDACKGFDGTWADNWGTTITMLAGKGQYVFQGINATIEGRIEGRKLIGSYLQPNYPDPIFERGTLEFELAADGKSWTGKSWDKDGKNEMGWDAVCVGAYAPPSPEGSSEATPVATPVTTPAPNDK